MLSWVVLCPRDSSGTRNPVAEELEMRPVTSSPERVSSPCVSQGAGGTGTERSRTARLRGEEQRCTGWFENATHFIALE